MDQINWQYNPGKNKTKTPDLAIWVVAQDSGTSRHFHMGDPPPPPPPRMFLSFSSLSYLPKYDENLLGPGKIVQFGDKSYEAYEQAHNMKNARLGDRERASYRSPLAFTKLWACSRAIADWF